MRRRPAPSCSLTSGAGAVPIQPKGIVARHSVLAAATRGCAVASAHLRPARLPHTAGLAACEHRTFSAQQAIGYRAVAVGFLGHQALIELSRANSPPSLSRRSFGCVPFSQQVCQTERLIFRNTCNLAHAARIKSDKRIVNLISMKLLPAFLFLSIALLPPAIERNRNAGRSYIDIRLTMRLSDLMRAACARLHVFRKNEPLCLAHLLRKRQI